MKGDEVKKLIMIPIFLVGALLTLSACAAQSQEPQVDDSSSTDDRTKAVLYKDAMCDTHGQFNGRAAGDQEDNSSQAGSNSQGVRAKSGGSIIVEGDDSDGTDGLDADDNMHSGQQLPNHFPIPVPDRYQVEAVGEAGNESAVILRVPSGEDAYNYYRQDLANAGFRVVDEGRNQGGFFDAELEFSSNALDGNMDFDGDRVEIDLERY
jgi:hypothetical protein